MLDRPAHWSAIRSLLRRFPVVAILGPRQVGKTTLARQVQGRSLRGTSYFDLEHAEDRARLADPGLSLGSRRGLVVIDEIQRLPELFSSLRVLADRPRRPARFLILGSASPSLLRHTTETLAGRIAHHELTGFTLSEVGTGKLPSLWLRGGFPRSFLARSESDSLRWRAELIRTYLYRDLPELGLRLAPSTLERFWAMLAHYHGQVWNASELGRAFGVADTTVRGYLDVLSATFMVRQLRPWFENLAKRQVKAPKIYMSDTGLLHALLGIRAGDDLQRHPKVGASWEGFLLGEVVHQLGAAREECYYWATHGGAELDLLVVRGRHRYGFEFKRTTAPTVTPSMLVAMEDLKLDRLDVVHAGSETFPLRRNIRAVASARILDDIARLRG